MIKKFNIFKLNENLTDDLTFNTKISNPDVDINFLREYEKIKEIVFEEDNYDIRKVNLIIDWRLDLDVREYGIKQISPIINNIYGNIEFVIWGENNDEEQNINFDNKIENFSIKIYKENNNSEALYPNNVSIDFKNKEIVVSF